MAPVVNPGSDAVRLQRLADFINADDWREKRRLAEQDPGLASRQTSRVLEGWIDQVESQGDAEAAEHLRWYADFITHVRTEGMSAAFEALVESAARLGDEALQRFYQSHTPDEAHDALDDAITSFAQALSANARPSSVRLWNSAAVAHSERYDLAGDLEDLHLAVGLTRRALQDTKPGDPARAPCLVNLAVFLLDRQKAGAGDPDDLTAAEEMARQAVREARQASNKVARDQLAAAWVVQAGAATARYDQAPDATLLEDAIVAAQSAVEVGATDRDRGGRNRLPHQRPASAVRTRRRHARPRRGHRPAPPRAGTDCVAVPQADPTEQPGRSSAESI